MWPSSLSLLLLLALVVAHVAAVGFTIRSMSVNETELTLDAQLVVPVVISGDGSVVGVRNTITVGRDCSSPSAAANAVAPTTWGVISEAAFIDVITRTGNFFFLFNQNTMPPLNLTEGPVRAVSYDADEQALVYSVHVSLGDSVDECGGADRGYSTSAGGRVSVTIPLKLTQQQVGTSASIALDTTYVIRAQYQYSELRSARRRLVVTVVNDDGFTTVSVPSPKSVRLSWSHHKTSLPGRNRVWASGTEVVNETRCNDKACWATVSSVSQNSSSLVRVAFTMCDITSRLAEGVTNTLTFSTLTGICVARRAQEETIWVFLPSSSSDSENTTTAFDGQTLVLSGAFNLSQPMSTAIVGTATQEGDLGVVPASSDNSTLTVIVNLPGDDALAEAAHVSIRAETITARLVDVNGVTLHTYVGTDELLQMAMIIRPRCSSCVAGNLRIPVCSGVTACDGFQLNRTELTRWYQTTAVLVYITFSYDVGWYPSTSTATGPARRRLLTAPGISMTVIYTNDADAHVVFDPAIFNDPIPMHHDHHHHHLRSIDHDNSDAAWSVWWWWFLILVALLFCLVPLFAICDYKDQVFYERRERKPLVSVAGTKTAPGS